MFSDRPGQFPVASVCFPLMLDDFRDFGRVLEYDTQI